MVKPNCPKTESVVNLYGRGVKRLFWHSRKKTLGTADLGRLEYLSDLCYDCFPLVTLSRHFMTYR